MNIDFILLEQLETEFMATMPNISLAEQVQLGEPNHKLFESRQSLITPSITISALDHLR